MNGGLTDRLGHLGGDRQNNGKGASHRAGVRELQTAVVSFGGPTADRKAQPRATPVTFQTRPHLIRAEKALKYARLQFGGNALAGITDSQTVLTILAAAFDRNGAADRRVLDGVVQEIHDHAPKQAF